MRLFSDHYKALGVSLTSSADEIKAAFLKLAKAHHPDRRLGDEELFKKVTNAYNVLGRAKSRARYDILYLKFYQRQLALLKKPVEISFARLVYPVKMQTLAAQGLLGRRVKRSYRRKLLQTTVNYDIELPLQKSEENRPLQLNIPLFARVTCPVCRGSNSQCYSCDGRGSQKTTEIFKLNIKDGVSAGQVIEINLEGQKPQAMAYFRKKKLIIKTTRQQAG